MKIFLLVIAAVVVCVFGQLNAANYYLSPSGNDNDSGASPTHAWATLQHARDVLVAGDTLFVMGGIYNSVQYWREGPGGTAANPVVIKAYGDAIAHFTTPGEMNGPTEPGFFMWWLSSGVDNVVVDGESYLNPGRARYFKFTGACYRMYRVEPSSGSRRSGMVLRGCEFDGSQSSSAGLGATLVQISYADSFTIDNCYIHHAWHPTGDSQNDGECVFIRSCEFGRITDNVLEHGNHGLMAIQEYWTQNGPPSRFITVSGNTFINDWGGGVYLTFNSSYCLLEYNIFIKNNATTDYAKPCLQVGGSNNTIRKNVFYSPLKQSITVQSHHEVGGHYSVCNGNYIYNNTVFTCDAYNLHFYVNNDGGGSSCSLENSVVANNIFYRTQSTVDSDIGCGNPRVNILFPLYSSNSDHNWVEPDEPGYLPNTTAWGGNDFYNNLFRMDSRGLARDSMVLYISDQGLGFPNCHFFTIGELEADGSGAWADNIGDDPMLRSEDPDMFGILSGWWYLLEGSPCIDAGMPVVDPNGSFVEGNYPGYGWRNLGYYGAAPDIGAYEFNGENPAPPIPPPLSIRPGNM